VKKERRALVDVFRAGLKAKTAEAVEQERKALVKARVAQWMADDAAKESAPKYPHGVKRRAALVAV
jgi:hypothetical protein